MAPDDNDSRRNRDRDRFDENNPFIAFRRFADSQFSSLLNTVFTLPATIANYKNVHVAREQCLFGRADKEQCKRLDDIEEETAKVLAECRELYRAGNVEQALDKGEALLQLNHAADLLRKQIVDNGRGNGFPDAHGYNVDTLGQDGVSEAMRIEMGKRMGVIPESAEGNSSRNELVEKVANEKGQQWGWSWDWGFPRPFDVEENASSRRERCRQWRRRREESALSARQVDEHNNALQEDLSALLSLLNDLHSRDWNADYQDPTSSAELARAGVPRDAFEDLLRFQNGLPLMPPEKLGQSDHLSHNSWARRFWDPTDHSFVGQHPKNDYPKRVPWEGEDVAEEPSYEYSHDHEDQHDEPPTPKTKQGNWSSELPETELEAYERLLGPIPTVGASDQTEGRPSVLSTLTTTERTVAPDGTVTTKVVLKKRFADGREESSETVHTQRGQEDDHSSRTLEALAQHDAQEQPRKSENKKTGWFWSN